MIIDPILGGMSGMSPYEDSDIITTKEETKPTIQYNTDQTFEFDASLVMVIILFIVFAWISGKVIGAIGTFVQRKEEKKFNELEIRESAELRKLVEEWKKENEI